MKDKINIIQLLVGGLILLLITWIIENRVFSFQNFEKSVTELKSNLRSIETDFFSILESNDKILYDIVDQQFDENVLSFLQQKPYDLLVYENGEVIFWTSNSIYFSGLEINQYNSGISYDHLNNGYYEIIKWPKKFKDYDSRYDIVALIPIKTEYSIENKYLSSKLHKAVPAGLNFSETKASISKKLSNENDNNGIYVTQELNTKNQSWIVVLLKLILIGLILMCIYFASLKVRNENKFTLGFLFLAISLIIIGLMTWSNLFPFNFQIGLQYKNEGIFSPGLLLLVSVSLFIVTYFVHNNLTYDFISKGEFKKSLKRFLYWAYWFFILSVNLWVIKYWLIHFHSSFTVYDLLDFNYCNFGSILILVSFAIQLMLIFQKSFTLIPKVAAFQKNMSLPFILALITFLFILGYCQLWIITCFVILIASLFVLSYLFPKFSIGEQLNLRGFIISAVLFSLITSAFIQVLSVKNNAERNQELARSYSSEGDLVTQYKLEDVTIGIVEDDVIKSYLYLPYLDINDLIGRIKSKYFSDYFLKYDIKVYPFYQNGTYLGDEENISLQGLEKRILAAQPSKSNYIYLISNPLGNFSYITKLPVFNDFGLLGFVVIELARTLPGQSNVYPELVIEDKLRTFSGAPEHSYAVYNFGILTNFNGDFNYPEELDKELKSYHLQESISIDNVSHFVYNPTDDKTIVITRPKLSYINPLSIFSYVIILYVTVIGIALLLFLFISNDWNTHYFKSIFFSTLKKRINTLIAAIILFSFLIIGALTIYYFSQESYSGHIENLNRNIKILQGNAKIIFTDVDQSFRNSEGTLSNLDQVAFELSEIHNYDVNLFGTDGKLLATSQSIIFDKGLVGGIINPNAFFKLNSLKHLKVIQEETIGNLEFLSGYAPFYNSIGNKLGYIQIPYFAGQNDLRQQISSFLLTLVNAYSLILILALIAGIYITSFISRSLTLIGQKLQQIRLGQTNERLAWPYEDEIGILVNQYNKTIEKLDKSANLLAISERQTAWQSMAKQIAHEIKNPLTPMKLSIQHLQRAQSEGHPQIKELTKRMTATLIEQIDHLSQIATEFSSFAQMPKGTDQILNAKEELNKVYDLYEDSENVILLKQHDESLLYIYADPNQLHRVFHNIIKNAVQAIPEERSGCIICKVEATIDDKILFTFSDNGKGIRVDDSEKVFVPNFTTKNSGMGLGLAITKNIIENAKGKIWFETEKDKGTNFFVQLDRVHPSLDS